MMIKTCEDCRYYENISENINTIMFRCKQHSAIYSRTDRGTCSGYEPIEVEPPKTVSTGQMIDMLLENPKRKAEALDGLIAKWVEEDGRLIKCEGVYGFNITSHDKTRKWIITEPEPEKITFTQAFKVVLKPKKIIESCVTNKEYSYLANLTSATDEELQGMWIEKERENK